MNGIHGVPLDFGEVVTAGADPEPKNGKAHDTQPLSQFSEYAASANQSPVVWTEDDRAHIHGY